MPPPWPPTYTDVVSHKLAKEMKEDEMAKDAFPAPGENPATPKAYETLFALMTEKFKACEVRESGALVDVKLEEFWEACELYRDMLSKLGSAAGMIVKDIDQNLTNAKAVYSEAPAERSTMSKFLELPVGHTGIAKLTWLCRGVEFFLVMIKKIFTQDSGNAATEAYSETLSQYHGWMLQQTLKIALRALPSKDAIVQSEGLVPGDISLDEKRALCERDAPPAASEALEVVHCVFDMMKKTGRWDAKKA
ncbi:unnamed protein product [Effrenium voratum]|nr:unnamed protein product [Effrenium voratum]CAJ1449748.1 unnamed protein product [Effrenium voratum]